MSVVCRLVLVCDVGVTQVLAILGQDWVPGPYVHEYTDHMGRVVHTDAASRATNFPVNLASRLFGEVNESSARTRWSTKLLNRVWSSDGMPASRAETSLVRAELLISAPNAVGGGDRPGVLALHFKVTAPSFAEAVQVANLLARQRGGAGASQLHGALTYGRLRTLHSDMCRGLAFPTDPGAAAETESTIYSMMQIDQMVVDGADPTVLSIPQAYSVASCQDPDRLHASEDALDRALNAVVPLSRSWSALFLRHGAAFLAHTTMDDAFRRFMETYFRTLYTDAVMLVRLQIQILRQTEVAIGKLLEDAATTTHLGSVSKAFEDLDRQLVINSARYWMRKSESNAGNAIKIIHSIQNAMSFDTRLDALDAQIDGLARISAADAQRKYLDSQKKLTTVVTLMGSIAIPVTFATDVYQLLGLPATLTNIGGLVLGVVVLGGITWWGLRRLLIKS